jgi:phage head maturation protease
MAAQPPQLMRAVPLVDFEIERGGDGRTVTAYAATFDDLYEVIDFDGHYDESINRAAFNRFLSGGIGRVKVMFNHGLNPMGGTSDKWSQPVAVPVDVTAETRGLLTRSRYVNTPAGDEALELWKSNAVTAQSFRGPIWRSSPRRPGPNGRPIIERLDLGLVEYGPAVFATNQAAGLVAIRSAVVDERLSTLDDLTPEERAELARLLTLDTPPDAPPPEADEEQEVVPDAPEDPGPSLDLLAAEAAQRRRRLP